MKKLLLCPAIAAFLLLASCGGGDSESPASLDVPNYDLTVFDKISRLNEEVPSLYPRYDYLTTYPYYIIILINGESSAYLVNPPSVPSGASRLNTDQSFGLEIYRYDDLIEQVRADLQGGLFTFFYDIDGVEYFVHDFREIDHFYLNYKNQDDNMIPGLVIHELFHVYQIEDWVQVVRQGGDVPLNQELLEYLLLQYEITTDAYDITASEYENYLAYYVAIWDKLIELDPTEEELLFNYGALTELIEGSARYVEHFSLKQSFFPSINADPTHGYRDFLYSAEDEASIRSALLFRSYYHQGAIAFHLMNELEIDIQNPTSIGLTPYEIARDHLAMDESEMVAKLEEAKTRVDWDLLVIRAAEFDRIIN